MAGSWVDVIGDLGGKYIEAKYLPKPAATVPPAPPVVVLQNPSTPAAGAPVVPGSPTVSTPAGSPTTPAQGSPQSLLSDPKVWMLGAGLLLVVALALR